MRKKIIISLAAATLILLSVSFVASADDIALMPVSYGKIVVQNNIACVEMKGSYFIIYSENASYIQFEGRYIKMYDLRIYNKGSVSVIEFNGFRFVDALV